MNAANALSSSRSSIDSFNKEWLERFDAFSLLMAFNQLVEFMKDNADNDKYCMLYEHEQEYWYEYYIGD